MKSTSRVLTIISTATRCFTWNTATDRGRYIRGVSCIGMVAVNENKQVETIFPMEGSGSCLSDGDVVGFDYHREIHIIRDLPTRNTDRRVTMKLHYVVYPRCFGFLGRFLAKLASFYNWAARNLFLNTIAPSNWFGNSWRSWSYSSRGRCLSWRNEPG